MKKQPAKRVDIVSLKMVKDGSVLYKNRNVRSPKDGYDLFKQVFGELDRENFVFMGLNTKSRLLFLRNFTKNLSINR